uniref:Uncharacterized protein n=1 Tax=Pristionchus pacificus TaxID=54126 RepID=A0A2A6CQU0_PRIPA|eukprot:PDM80582.1 hypothetical protein PRIPAC_35585 [Pristionchus pacificus]
MGISPSGVRLLTIYPHVLRYANTKRIHAILQWRKRVEPLLLLKYVVFDAAPSNKYYVCFRSNFNFVYS